MLVDGVEHQSIALVFSHCDAHAFHTRACPSLLGRADIDFLPMRFNEAEAH
jgi:hypothetical protein